MYYDDSSSTVQPTFPKAILTTGLQAEKILFNKNEMLVFGTNTTNTTAYEADPVYYMTSYMLNWDG